MSKHKILLVEDDANLGFVIKDNFEQFNFEVVLADNGKQAMEIFNEQNFDLCIVDVMLPIIDGFTLAEYIRSKNESIPMLFLTAKTLKEDKLKAFNIGADDYITKPFSIEELILRCKVFLKRSNSATTAKSRVFNIASYTFDAVNLFLEFNNQKKKLTLREACLLELLCVNMGQVVKREHILTSVWGNDDYFTGRSMDVFISRLRKYLANDPTIEIINYHSVGFMLKLLS